MPTESRLAYWVEKIEQTFIAVLFAAMAIVTTTQVVMRYVFNSGFVWALELTTFLFAWLVLFGASYGVKVGVHLGVDAFINLFGEKLRKAFALAAVAAGLAYAGILFVGAFDYVLRLFAIGIEAVDLPIPRWIPYLILPVGLALLAIRLLEAGVHIWQGRRDSLLSNEVREAIRQFGGDGHAREEDSR